ncbi:MULTISPECIES: hypothetical protein [Cellulophaga]|jgi:hypothetical protein|uniref:Uncharacterized protein n=2 Tax=Cellulophaga baltica TaxID=76594 RepID=A0A1G7HLK9_9FLAO|nr:MULTISPECIES: hypothetical protein [Cellulophaga]WFO16762.1 hypothetical protein M601_002895 [Cellulophaga baltica 4]AIY14439.1 hypothetical protein M667_15285 [Cellulophaga baltica NN016038]AIZ42809.1 hypothetical protein M666_15240 [Cellulophaga baltica 18]KGK30629.1 hypothetical protein EL45_09485 [Cellulophaga sp. E6(2014)]MBA6316580.1 hypothetical protein [Cellulophaga baltica]
MASNFGIGANDVKGDASEALNEIPQNRTLIAGKLTPNTPIKPEVIEGLRTVEDIFEHFRPELKVPFEDKNGGTINETIKFSNLGDFGKKGITNNSVFLKELEIESDQYKKIIKQLKTNKILKSALQDPEAKEALIDTIDALINEIKNTK